MSPSEGLAFIYDVDDAPHLFLSYQPEGTTGLARRLNPETYYLATRWDYDQYPKDYLLTEMALVRIPKTGKQVKVYPADWGPHVDTNRVADVSPAVMEYLGIKTDDEVEVIFPFTHRHRAAGQTISAHLSCHLGTPRYAKVQSVFSTKWQRPRAWWIAAAELLRQRGVDCKTFHDTTSKDQNTNLHKITDWHNAQPARTRCLGAFQCQCGNNITDGN